MSTARLLSDESPKSQSPLPLLEPVRLSRKTVRQVGSDLARFILVQPMLRNQARKKGAVDATCHIVSGGNGEKRASVIIETDGVVEAGGFCRVFAKAHHAFGTVMEPPGWP